MSGISWSLELLLSEKFGKIPKSQQEFLRATYEASIKISNRISDLLMAMDIVERRILIERERYNLLSSIQDLEKLKNDISLNIAGQYLQILFNVELHNVAQEQLEVTQTQVHKSVTFSFTS